MVTPQREPTPTEANFHHIPVLLNEAVNALNIRPDGVYVDGTLGGGGHAQLIASKLNNNGKLLGIDRDMEALEAATVRVPGLVAVHGNFHSLPNILRTHGIAKIDGILLDLGVSSHQLDTAGRGFSYRFDGPLDMRMDTTRETTAADIVNTAAQAELERILYQYGEERHTPRIVRAIIASREKNVITTTQELVTIIEAAVPPHPRTHHPAMRTFMALRIAVNDELAPLERALTDIAAYLNPGGRLAVITFHSLEDRIVKHTFRKLANPCTCPRDIPYCACGKKPQLHVITRRPILPGASELINNNRAHSAKLRIAEKIHA